MNKQLENIKNYYAFDNQIATSGQPEANEFELIRNSGFELVINLALPDSPDAIPDENRIMEELEIPYSHIPVDFKNPTQENIDLFFSIMQENKAKKIFVHCAYNWRVSAFMFLYRSIVLEEPMETARKDLLKVWQPDETWENFMQAVLARYSKD